MKAPSFGLEVQVNANTVSGASGETDMIFWQAVCLPQQASDTFSPERTASHGALHAPHIQHSH